MGILIVIGIFICVIILFLCGKIIFIHKKREKMISNFELSPTATTVFSNGALVHPQPGTTFRILSSSSSLDTLE